MINVFLTRTFGAFLPIIISIFFIHTISAQVPCGTISYLDGNSTLIDDCSDPFERTSGESPVVVTIGGDVVSEGMSVEIEGESTDTFTFDFNSGFGYTATLFEHVDGTYIEQPLEVIYPEDDPTEAEYRIAMIAYFPEGTNIDTFVEVAVLDDTDTLTEIEEGMYYDFIDYYYSIFYAPQQSPIPLGIYTAVFTEEIICLSSIDRSLVHSIYSWVIPTAHAQYCSGIPRVYTLTFEIIEKIVIPPIDPLILQYAPILYFHPEEDYFPMDVESFVEASALWDRNDTEGDELIKSAQDLTFSEFKVYTSPSINSSDLYLAFSDPDTPRSIDLQRAKSTYAAIDIQSPTVYYKKMTDETDYGKTFTVLQYWYFYAMNNWGEHDGYNDHEGDWESTFVFLNEDEEPEYVAYSSHLNDGLSLNNIKQYASVRRNWNDVIEVDNHLASFVALGSHANYFNLGNGGSYIVGTNIDEVNVNGLQLFTENYLHGIYDSWSKYKGLFGTFVEKEGSSGPQGPIHINVTGQTRFLEPVEWAGLNNFLKVAVNTATDTVEDTKQGVRMVFDALLNIGSKIVVERYDEYVTFGKNLTEFRPLPYFFEVTSDTETSGLTMTISYDPEYLESIGELADNLVILYYNPTIDLFEALESAVDTDAYTVTAYTPHLSRYLLGFQERDVTEKTDGIEPVATTTPANNYNYGTRIERPIARVLGVTTDTSYNLKQLQQLTLLVEGVVELSEGREDMSDDERVILGALLSEIKTLLQSLYLK